MGVGVLRAQASVSPNSKADNPGRTPHHMLLTAIPTSFSTPSNSAFLICAEPHYLGRRDLIDDNQYPTLGGSIPKPFYRHASAALLNAASVGRDGKYIRFAYALQEVVDAIRCALQKLSEGDSSVILSQTAEFQKMSDAR